MTKPPKSTGPANPTGPANQTGPSNPTGSSNPTGPPNPTGPTDPTGQANTTGSSPEVKLETGVSKYDGKSSVELLGLIELEETNLEKFEKAENEIFESFIKDTKTRLQNLNVALHAAIRRDQSTNRYAGNAFLESKPVIETGRQHQWERRLQAHCAALPKFQGTSPDELTSFLTEINQIYDILVKNKPDAGNFFIEEIKLKLDAEIQTRLNDAGGAQSVEKLTKWLRETYGEQHTSFQLLAKAWTCEYKSGSHFVSYASAIERHMRTARDHIKALWVKNNGRDMSVDESFDLFNGMLMTEVVRKDSFEIYQALIPKLDKLTTASKVANEAEAIRTQYGSKKLTSNERVFYAPRGLSKNNSIKQKEDNSKKPSFNERLSKQESEISEIKQILLRLESKNQPKSQALGGKQAKKKKNWTDKSQKKQPVKPDESQTTYITEQTLECPDLSEAEKNADFH